MRLIPTVVSGRRAVAIGAAALAIIALPSAAEAGVHPLHCGHVSSRYGRFKVDVLRGELKCDTARHVIRYVLHHGPPSQGAPGKSPPHWSCGWGFGYYHGHREQMGRSGPLCSSGSREVEGTGPGFTLEPSGGA